MRGALWQHPIERYPSSLPRAFSERFHFLGPLFAYENSCTSERRFLSKIHVPRVRDSHPLACAFHPCSFPNPSRQLRLIGASLFCYFPPPFPFLLPSSTYRSFDCPRAPIRFEIRIVPRDSRHAARWTVIYFLRGWWLPIGSDSSNYFPNYSDPGWKIDRGTTYDKLSPSTAEFYLHYSLDDGKRNCKWFYCVGICFL